MKHVFVASTLMMLAAVGVAAADEWADPAKVITKVLYRMDGVGNLKDMYFHIFVLPADGGTPRQITSGNFHHRDPRWTPDGEALVFSANRHDEWEYEPRNSEVYSVDLKTREITALTDRLGPDGGPAISHDGAKIAYLGYDDRYQGYQVTRLYLMTKVAHILKWFEMYRSEED